LVQLVPAHVRHLQAGHVAEAHHVTGEQIETAVLAVLVAGREQHLHSQANAKELLALADMLPDRRRQPALVDAGNSVPERPDARQDELVALRDTIRVGADLRRKADLLEGLLYAAQVGHPIIDNQDPLHRYPFCLSREASAFGTILDYRAYPSS